MTRDRFVGIITILCMLAGALFPAYAQHVNVSWSTFTAGFETATIQAIELTSAAGQSVAGTTRDVTTTIQSGFLPVNPRALGTAIGEDRLLELPMTTSLYQNYPNPFNPVTRIRYTLAAAGGTGLGARKTRLVVYDLLGREVAVLVNEDKRPGHYTIPFDGSRLAGGAYFYRLTAGDFVSTKKLLLVK